MSTMRETAARVAAEMREYICAPYRNVNDQLLRRWATELDAAVKADAEVLCEWQEDAPRVSHCTGCGQFTTETPGRYCLFCGRKVRVTS